MRCCVCTVRLCAQWVDVGRSIVCRYVPIGLRKWFKSCGVENVEELNWWESAEFVKTVPSDDGACINPPPPQPVKLRCWLTAHRGRARRRAGGADSGGGHAGPALVDSQRLRSVQEPVDQLGGSRRVESRVVRRRHGLLPGLQGDRRHPRPLQSRVRAHNALRRVSCHLTSVLRVSCVSCIVSCRGPGLSPLVPIARATSCSRSTSIQRYFLTSPLPADETL